METIQQSIYDFPRYYDLVYGSDWKAECLFLKRCFEKFATGEVVRLFEPACGTGRLLYRFGKKGYQVSGLDLNAKAVAYFDDVFGSRVQRSRSLLHRLDFLKSWWPCRRWSR